MLGRWINPKLMNWTDRLRRRRRMREMKKLRKASGKAVTYKRDRSARCENCHASLTGPFCHLCGQKAGDMRRPIWDFLEEISDSFFDVDSKIIKTLLILIALPGRLTRDYMSGRRARFIPPIRLFIVSFFMFFFIINMADIAIVDVSYMSDEEREKNKSAQNLVIDENGNVVMKKGIVTLKRAPEEVLQEMQGKELDEAAEVMKKAGIDVAPILARIKAREKAQGGGEEGDAVKEPVKQADKSGVQEKDQAAKDLEEKIKEAVAKGKEAGRNDNNFMNPSNQEFFDRIKVNMLTSLNDEDRIPIPQKDLDAVIKTQADKDEEGWISKLRVGLAKALADPKKMNELLNDRVQWALLFVMPIFAVLLRLMHWRKDQRLMQQLVFSLHFHAFAMVWMIIITPMVPLFGGETAMMVFSYGIILYFFISLKIGQRQGWIRTFFKFLLLWPLYLILLASFVGWGLVEGLQGL